MTIGEMKAAWRDLPDSTNIFLLDENGGDISYRSVSSLDIQRTFDCDEDGDPVDAEDCFNIRISEE